MMPTGLLISIRDVHGGPHQANDGVVLIQNYSLGGNHVAHRAIWPHNPEFNEILCFSLDRPLQRGLHFSQIFRMDTLDKQLKWHGDHFRNSEDFEVSIVPDRGVGAQVPVPDPDRGGSRRQ